MRRIMGIRRLISVETRNITILAGESKDISETFHVKANCTYKAFVWSKGTLTPVSKAIDVPAYICSDSIYVFDSYSTGVNVHGEDVYYVDCWERGSHLSSSSGNGTLCFPAECDTVIENMKMGDVFTIAYYSDGNGGFRDEIKVIFTPGKEPIPINTPLKDYICIDNVSEYFRFLDDGGEQENEVVFGIVTNVEEVNAEEADWGIQMALLNEEGEKSVFISDAYTRVMYYRPCFSKPLRLQTINVKAISTSSNFVTDENGNIDFENTPVGNLRYAFLRKNAEK